MRRGTIGTVSIAIAVGVLLTAARNRAVRPPEVPVVLSVTRSFEVTDKAIVASFTLTRVLTQMIERSGVKGVTADQLIRQMFDTQNPRAGSFDPEGPHCDDTFTNGVPSFNGFPRRCPAPEGKLAAVQNLAGQFFTLGVMNRFDQAPPDGSNCGQYRMVFAHKDSETSASTLVRRHLIFEAILPNPNPALGLVACRPVAQFWANLSAVDSMDERRAQLDKFFFQGLDGFVPVVDAPNFAEPGGIRTLQQSADASTNLSVRFYQFRIAKQCGSAGCTLRFTPDVLENMPFGLLFDGANTSAQARALRAEFVRHVQTLAIEDLNLMSMKLPRDYLMAESDPLGNGAVMFFEQAFNNGKTTPDGIAFQASIQSELDRAGSKLTPNNVMTRAEELNCSGCHGFNGAVPFGGNVKLVIGFQGNQMISEDIFADGEAGPSTRYGIDPIIEKQFIPHRMQILTDFLRSGTPPVHSQ
jgi:hypothetical protein